MTQGEAGGYPCSRASVTRRRGRSRPHRPQGAFAGLLLCAIAGCTILGSARISAEPAGAPDPTSETDEATDTATNTGAAAPSGDEHLTHAQRFERSPGVLGTSIRTMRQEMVKDYADESLGYLALDFEDMGLNPVSKDEGLRLNLADKLQFRSRKDALPKEAKPVLDGIARIMVDNPAYLIQVIAHTDNRGSANTNMRLSKRRAEAVKTYLSERGIEEVRLIAIGLGETEPLAPASGRNPTRQERAKNRRVELLIAPMDLPAPQTDDKADSAPPVSTTTP